MTTSNSADDSATDFNAGQPLDAAAQSQLFTQARTFRYWLDKPVSADTLRAVADLMKMGPTSGNTCPARIVFVVSSQAKERLRPHLDAGNVRQTMSAPATAIIGYDSAFYEKLAFLNPAQPQARSWFEGDADAIAQAGTVNGSLQGAYLILAARTLGLDCGPMGGFDKTGVERTFFPDGKIRAIFLCNLGYGDRDHLRPRQPRFGFDEFCSIA